MSKSLREKGLAHANGADDGDVLVGIEEAQGHEFVEERTVEGDLGGVIPRFKTHRGIEPGFVGAQRDGLAVAARGFILQDQ